MRACDYLNEFDKPKILYSEITAFFPFIYDNKGLMCNNKIFFITAQDDTIDLKFLTAIFNSKLCKLWIWYNCPELLGGTREIRKVYFEKYTIPSISKEVQQPFIALADTMLSLHEQLQEKRSRFLRRLTETIVGVKITTAMQTFDQLDFAGFVAELKKQKIKLTLRDLDDWEDYFNKYHDECQQLNVQITQTDNEIDLRVYKLYGLTYDEVLTVDPKTSIRAEDYGA